MISDHQLGWMKEFLLGLCEREADSNEVDDIIDTFRKLWVVAKAAEQNPFPRSPRLAEALAATKDPGKSPKPGRASLY